MVSLRKAPQAQTMREITPVHLIDEEEAVRTYCPPKGKEASANDIEKVVKQADKALLPAKSADKGKKGEWIEILIKTIFVSGLVFIFVSLLNGLVWGGIKLLFGTI